MRWAITSPRTTSSDSSGRGWSPVRKGRLCPARAGHARSSPTTSTRSFARVPDRDGSLSRGRDARARAPRGAARPVSGLGHEERRPQRHRASRAPPRSARPVRVRRRGSTTAARAPSTRKTSSRRRRRAQDPPLPGRLHQVARQRRRERAEAGMGGERADPGRDLPQIAPQHRGHGRGDAGLDAGRSIPACPRWGPFAARPSTRTRGPPTIRSRRSRTGCPTTRSGLRGRSWRSPTRRSAPSCGRGSTASRPRTGSQRRSSNAETGSAGHTSARVLPLDRFRVTGNTLAIRRSRRCLRHVAAAAVHDRVARFRQREGLPARPSRDWCRAAAGRAGAPAGSYVAARVHAGDPAMNVTVYLRRGANGFESSASIARGPARSSRPRAPSADRPAALCGSRA